MITHIRPATLADLPIIRALRRDRSAWLADRGSDQWSAEVGSLSMNEFTERITTGIAAGHTWVADVEGRIVGTITIDETADPGLWTDDELHTAAIIHHMIVDRDFAGYGVGKMLLAHADQIAIDLRPSLVAFGRLDHQHWPAHLLPQCGVPTGTHR